MKNSQVSNELDADLIFTVTEAALLLKVSRNHAYSLVAQGLIPHVRVGKLIRIPRWGLIQFLAVSPGAPLPANIEVAIDSNQSVHGQQPENKEDNSDGEG